MAATPAAAAAAPAAAQEQLELSTEAEVLEVFNRLRQEQSSIMSRVAEIENEKHEHTLVKNTLSPLNGDRRCHRLVGGVLVERTVGEVLPLVEHSLNNFVILLENLNESLGLKEKEIEAFMAKYKIKMKNPGQGQAAPIEAPEQEGGKKRVLA